jgi:hypothetical protein
VSYTKQGLCLAYGGAAVIGASFSSLTVAAMLGGLIMVLHGCILCLWDAS